MRKFLKLVAILVLAASGQVTHADTFQGTVWSLTNLGLQPDADVVHETFRIELDVNTAGYSGTGSFLDQVAVKVSSSLFASSLFSAPSGTANWLLVDGGINASGCSGSGSGFLCANSDAALNSGKGVSVPDGTYSWVFDLTVDNGTLFTDLNEASVKGRFVDSAGAKVGDLVSENVTLLAVPEPEIYAMLGIGLALMGFVGRRRKQAAA